MKILRVKLRNYRGVEEREVRLAPRGVTVIQGPNEIGKSSLAEAFGVVFKHLDSSRKADVEAIKPVHADEGAEVEVDVECGGYAFTLSKRFHKRPQTRLEVRRPRAESLTGREAHERALAILDETVDRHLWEALCIEQGTGVVQADLKKQPALAAALDQAAGGAAAGEREETLFEAARKECERHFTEKGKPRKELEEAAEAEARAREEVESLAAEIGRLEKDIECCSRLEREITRLRGEEAGLKAQADRREAEWKAVQGRQQSLRTDEAKRNEALAVVKNAAAEVTARQELVAAAAAAREAHQKLQADIEARRPAREDAAGALRDATRTLEAARREEAGAARLLELRRLDRDRLRDELDLAQLRERQGRIEAAEKEAAGAEKLLRQTRMSDALLKQIESAQLALDAARARLDAARATVVLEALADISPAVGGAALSLARGERRDIPVEGSLTIELAGAVRLTVRSGSSLAALEEERHAAERRVEALCGEGAVADLDAARAANEARREAERRKKRKDEVLRADLRDLTPAGLASKVKELELRLGDVPARRPEDPPLPASLEAANELLEGAQAAAREASAAREGADRAQALARQRDAQEEKHAVEGGVRLRLLAEGAERAGKALERARAEKPDGELERAREEAAARARALETAYGEACMRLKAEDPERVEELARRAREALAAAARELRARENELLELASTLKARGEDGLEERRGEAAARLARLERERAALVARAEAARLLFETLREKREEARRRYAAPLRERIEKLGRLVFGPSFAVELGEELQVVSRSLDGRTVAFQELSMGAQEQIAVIARLACAMTVSADGGVPVVLDDALGYSDPERLEQMGAVLSQAGRETQVIVLTCMPERYRHAGNAEVVRLS